MRTLENKACELRINADQTIPSHYANILQNAVDYVPNQQTIPTSEIRKRVALHDILANREVGDKLNFEEEEYKKMCELMQNSAWVITSPSIVQCEDELLALEKQ